MLTKVSSMETALIVRGRISNSRHIELDEGTVDVFELISAASPGTRSKEDIDRQIADERGSWDDR